MIEKLRQTVLKVESLSKNFSNVKAVNNISFSVDQDLLRKLAAKIFRVSILITGKEPTWREVYKLSKQA